MARGARAGRHCEHYYTGVRMIASQDIYCEGRQLTHGTVEACIISLTGKPKRIPQDTRDKLSPFLLETVA